MNETCGCCEGLEPLTPLATANRPGLDALAYRAGTHATFLETMKARLSAGEYPALRGLSTRAADDPSLALLDAWATVADVLTFYQERIANEGYLRTATERRSILELARLVGYVPRPGVAASVYLAFTLEDGYDLEIPSGTRAQSLPGPGESPQSFETAEKLEARAGWNILEPRSSRPQSLRPLEPKKGGVLSRRLYLKGVANNLEPNDPLLIDFGDVQEFFRVRTVEPDPEADHTLLTLTPVARHPLMGSGTSVRIEDLRARMDRYLDLEAYEVSPERETTRRVVVLLREWRADLTPEKPPEELAASLRERVLPQLRQDLDNARQHDYRQLTPWLEDVEAGLREIEEQLSAGSGEPDAARASLAPTVPNGNGGSASATLEGLLERLARPPSVQPTNASRLPRTLEKSFGSGSDGIPQLLTALRPGLRRTLYQAWERTGAEPGAARVYALRVTASPFGHNAPPRPILEDGKITDYEEWTLERTASAGKENFGVYIRIGQDGDSYGIEITVTLEDELQTHGPQDLANGTFYLLFAQAEETVTGTISEVEGDIFKLELTFRNRGATVEIRDRVDGGVIITGAGEQHSLSTRITVDIKGGNEFEVTSNGSDPTTVTVGLDEVEDGQRQILVSGEMPGRSTEATEEANVVSLDTSYKQVLPGSWVVLERPDAAGSIPRTVITQGDEVREASRADYGITAKSTQITLPEPSPWIDPDQDTFAVVRGTSVHAGSELLELAEAPLEVVEDGMVKVEPLCGQQIELNALYDGLKPGRWLFVTGEREDLPGVTASELVMLAGVTQETPRVKTIAGTVRRVRAGEPESSREIDWNLSLAAYLLPDGSATGYAGVPGWKTGRVVQVVPPSGTKDFWCINVEYPTSHLQTNFYIRDIGDGIASFDQIQVESRTVEVDCAALSDPPGEWMTLTDGDDFKATDLPVDTVHSTLLLANDLAYCYKRETVRIYGNVARATHGETRGEALGSGDGGQALQRFTLKQSPLTHVAATTPRGVESTLKVYVNDIRWHEAEHLAGLRPTDRRFITQTDDEGEVTLVFGDGRRGARLPTGVENLRAVYRTGIGKAGNVAAEQISLLATSPLGLKGVINSLPATGGADRETRDEARHNAPLGVKVLDRLVSARDYEDFARAFAGIGKSSAVRLSDGRRQLVHLTIAGADDIPIAGDSDLYRHLLQALQRFGDPQQPLRVDMRELILLIISAGVRLLPDYLWESVEPGIRAALLDTFGFERRELSQDALLSEVIGTIQRVSGVAYVDVDTFGGIPEKAVDTGTGLRRPLLPSEIEAEITKLAEGEDQPFGRVPVAWAGYDRSSIHPAQLAFLTPQVPDTLILKEITS